MFPKVKSKCDEVKDGGDSYKTKRRRLNNILPQIVQKFSFEVLAINGIKPDVIEYFEMSTGLLSGKGMEMFWQSLSKELRLADEKLKEMIKNKIIGNYLEDQEERKSIEFERGKIRNERFVNQRVFPRQNFDRGDGRNQSNARSKVGRARRGNSAHR